MLEVLHFSLAHQWEMTAKKQNNLLNDNINMTLHMKLKLMMQLYFGMKAICLLCMVDTAIFNRLTVIKIKTSFTAYPYSLNLKTMLMAIPWPHSLKQRQYKAAYLSSEYYFADHHSIFMAGLID